MNSPGARVVYRAPAGSKANRWELRAALHPLGLGEKDAALRWLEKGLAERAYLLGFAADDPRYDALQSDPRFISILEEVGVRRNDRSR